MKYFTRLKVYKTSNNELSLEKKYAFSYGWWQYYTEVEGITIFNDTRYSTTTNKHQRESWLMIGANTIDLVLSSTQCSLVNPIKAVKNEISNCNLEIGRIQDKINTPRTHKLKNEDRKKQIEQIKQHIARCENAFNLLTKGDYYDRQGI